MKAGQLSAFLYDDSGGKIVLGGISPGEFVGEMGYFNQELCSATVEALTDVELVSIPDDELEAIVFFASGVGEGFGDDVVAEVAEGESGARGVRRDFTS